MGCTRQSLADDTAGRVIPQPNPLNCRRRGHRGEVDRLAKVRAAPTDRLASSGSIPEGWRNDFHLCFAWSPRLHEGRLTPVGPKINRESLHPFQIRDEGFIRPTPAESLKAWGYDPTFPAIRREKIPGLCDPFR